MDYIFYQRIQSEKRCNVCGQKGVKYLAVRALIDGTLHSIEEFYCSLNCLKEQGLVRNKEKVEVIEVRENTIAELHRMGFLKTLIEELIFDGALFCFDFYKDYLEDPEDETYGWGEDGDPEIIKITKEIIEYIKQYNLSSDTLQCDLTNLHFLKLSILGNKIEYLGLRDYSERDLEEYFGCAEEIYTPQELLEAINLAEKIAEDVTSGRCNKEEIKALQEKIDDLRREDLYRSSQVATLESRVKIEDIEDVNILIDLLKDKTLGTRLAVAKRLGELKDSRAVGPLIKLILKDKHVTLRMTIARALGELGDPRAVEPLVELLKELKGRNPNICSSIIYALGKIKDIRAINALIEVINDKEGYYSLRKAAAKMLGEIEDTKVEQVLLSAIETKDLEVISGAYKFFIKKGKEEAIPLLIEVLNKTKTWNPEVAEYFLNCGNSKLEDAAREWANLRRKTLSVKSNSLKWGLDKMR